MPDLVYTIGHSNHSAEKFLSLLAAHDVNAVADVRSHPYSRFCPQFNKQRLDAELKHAGFLYVFLGRELGVRTEDPSCYENGKVHYDRLAQTQVFREGLQRISHGVKSHRIALMCAEKDPLTCHRGILICRHLAEQGIEARHILEDGCIEPHDLAVERLLMECGLSEDDLFRSREDRILDAYRLRGQQIAYAPQVEEPTERPSA